MTIQFRRIGQKGWGRLSGLDLHAAKKWIEAEWPGVAFELRHMIARTPKVNPTVRLVSVRLTLSQAEAWDKLPGSSNKDKLLGLLALAALDTDA